MLISAYGLIIKKLLKEFTSFSLKIIHDLTTLLKTSKQ